MSILTLFVVIPALMLLGLWLAKNLNQVRGVMVAGASCLLALSIWLTIYFIQERSAGNTAEMLLTYSAPWFKPLNNLSACLARWATISLFKLTKRLSTLREGTSCPHRLTLKKTAAATMSRNNMTTKDLRFISMEQMYAKKASIRFFSAKIRTDAA